MQMRVEQYTPPKGHPWGEWDEVAGWTLHQSELTDRLRNDGYPLLTLNYTESSRPESLRISRAGFLSSTGLSASTRVPGGKAVELGGALVLEKQSY